MSTAVQEKPERLVSVAAAADRLGLSIWTLRAWCYAGKFASCKLGGRLLIPESEIERAITESLRPAVQR
jgi:excisionase family DNA binding protein